MRQGSIVLALAASLLSSSLPALAGQAGLPRPRVEFGLDASVSAAEGTGRAVGGRVTFNLAPDTALTGLADVYAAKKPYGLGWRDNHLFAVELRRAVEQSRRLTIALIAGGGIVTSRRYFPGFVSGSGPTPVTFPAEMFRETGGAVTVGAGFEERVSPRLSLHQDIRYVFAEEGSELRAQFGLSVPHGRYADGPVAESYVFGGEPLRTGHAVWIAQADGTTVTGRVATINATALEVATAHGRTLVRTRDVVRIDRPDTVTNGAKIGATIGAVGGAVLIGGLVYALCEGDCDTEILGAAFGAGMGVGVGALIGALADSLHVGRRTIFERKTERANVTVAPVLEANARGARATISW